MARVKQLISELAAEGELESRGTFTLDREKAKVKMRQFQLADPHRYVLVLVQAAVLKGATAISFEIDADDMRMSFDGAPFDEVDLDELYTSLFGGQRDRTIRARQELAVAVNAAMGLNPRYVVLESGDGARGVKLELRPERPDVVESLENVPAGTRIHVKDQFRPGLLVRFLRDLQGEIVEEKLLRQCCAWASVNIRLDGEPISRQTPLADAVGRVELRGADATGVAGFVRDDDWRARVDVLNNGVWLAVHELPGFPLGFRAVVDGTALQKDVSQTDVVRNEAYSRMRFALRRACEESLVQACARYSKTLEVWLAAVLRGALFAEAKHIEGGLGQRPFIDALCDLPLWRDAGEQWVSTRQVLEAAEPGYTVKPLPPLQLPEGTCIVLARRDDEKEFFSRLAHGKVTDRTKYLERLIRNESNRQAWRQRRQEPKLGVGQYEGRASIDAHGVRGEIGIMRAGLEKASIRLVLDGCLLCELNPKFPMAGVVAVLQAPLTPRADYHTANRDDALAACVRAFAEGLLEVVTQLARRWGAQPLHDDVRRLALAYLIVLSTGGYRSWLFRQFGFSSSAAARRAAQSEDWNDRPRWGLGEGDPHPLTALRLFDSADGRVLSLRELFAATAEDGKLWWIDREEPAVHSPRRLVVRVTQRQRRILEQALGADRLVDCEQEYARWVEHEAFLLRARVPLELDRWVHESVEFELEGLRGVLGLASFSISADGDELVVPEMGVSADMVNARLLLDGRHLCDHWFTVGVPGLAATLTGDLIVPNGAYSDLEGETWIAVARALGEPVARLLERLAALEGRRELGDSVRYALLLGLRATFGSARMVHAYSRLLERDPEHAVVQYAGLQRLCTRYTNDEVGQVVRKLLRKGEDPTPGAVEAALRRRGCEPGEWYEPEAEQRIHLASALGVVARVRLFPLAGREDVDFLALLALRASRRIRYVDRRLAAQVGYDGTEPIVVVDDVLRLVLEDLFGPRGIEDASDWLEQWDNERQLANRQQLEQLRVPAAAMLAILQLEGQLEGEIGLPRARPLAGARSFVQLCKHRRPVCTVELAHTLPVSAVLDWSELEIQTGDDGLLSTTSECAGWIASRIDESLGALMDVLASKKLTVTEAEQARVYVLMYLAHCLPRRPRERRERLAGPLARIAALPVFEDIHGELHSFADLDRHYAARGKLSYLTTTAFERPDDRIVVCARHDEFDAWRALFPELVDFNVENEQERKLRQRRAMLRRLPERPPEGALAFRRVDQDGLEGFVWLEGRQGQVGTAAEVGFGADGLQVGTLVVDPYLCCCGAVQGPGVRVSTEWDYFEIGEDGVRHLRELALQMYEQLAEDGGPAEGGGPRAGGAGPVDWILRAMAGTGPGPMTVLRDALVRLHADRFWAALSQRERALYRRMCALPLFELSTGKAISLQVAVRERPTELARYQLWEDVEPDSASALVAELVQGQHGRVQPPVPVPVPAPASVPAPAPEPQPEPPPVPATPEELLLDAIRAELRVVRTANQNLLSDGHLDLIELRAGAGRVIELTRERVVINVTHPVFTGAIQDRESDPVQVSFLASLVYTALNVLLEEITDQHEHVFHRVHATHVLSAVLVGDGDEDGA